MKNKNILNIILISILFLLTFIGMNNYINAYSVTDINNSKIKEKEKKIELEEYLNLITDETIRMSWLGKEDAISKPESIRNNELYKNNFNLIYHQFLDIYLENKNDCIIIPLNKNIKQINGLDKNSKIVKNSFNLCIDINHDIIKPIKKENIQNLKEKIVSFKKYHDSTYYKNYKLYN